MESETSEQRITPVLQKITKKMEEYFSQLVEEKCSRLKSDDATWYNDTMKEIISNFEKQTSNSCAEIISQYNINNKYALLDEANTKLKRQKSWRPSGNPQKDIRGHILPLNKSYMENLRSYSLELESKVSKNSAKLAKLRSTLQEEYIEFQSIAEKLKELSKSAEDTGPHIPNYRVSHRQ